MAGVSNTETPLFGYIYPGFEQMESPPGWKALARVLKGVRG